jgi:hypothetical protein
MAVYQTVFNSLLDAMRVWWVARNTMPARKAGIVAAQHVSRWNVEPVIRFSLSAALMPS